MIRLISVQAYILKNGALSEGDIVVEFCKWTRKKPRKEINEGVEFQKRR
jgi:hypothetical protein